MDVVNTTKGKRRRYYPAEPKYKYAIFAGETFYPAGGFEDFYGFAMTYAEALEIYCEAKTTGARPRTSWWGNDRDVIERGSCDWAHVVNLKKQKIVFP